MRIGINGSGRMLTGGVAGVLEDLTAAEAAGFASYWVAQVGLVDALPCSAPTATPGRRWSSAPR